MHGDCAVEGEGCVLECSLGVLFPLGGFILDDICRDCCSPNFDFLLAPSLDGRIIMLGYPVGNAR